MTHVSNAPAGHFEEVFETHHRRVLAYALRRTAGEADAEDVVAETFAVAWRRVADLPPTENALPWLFGVARRVVANHHRGGRRRFGLLERLRSEPQVIARAALETPATEALARLGADDQELLRLLAWEGLHQSEAGEILGISANAVAIRLHRVRRRFAEELAAIEGGDTKGSGASRTSDSAGGRLPGQTPRERTT
ncbi:MAG: sigma-70 family RNA polymerase sigma factor [Chloroflexi bacterium]|nr:sigma-70 family RNA polymerase sigma factor [Chloroflexota bacterium]